MKTTHVIIFLCLVSFCAFAQGREEFNGPFKSWGDVKKRFGAKGDGKSDDTRALQTALDNVGTVATAANNMGKDIYTVVYLPAGTYCISSTLVLRGKLGVNIMGEDPTRTTIKWIGNDKDTLLWTNGSAYFKIGRLSWDANGRKGMEAIGIHWKDKWNDGVTRSYATLNIEISDNYFIGGFARGVAGGTYGGNNGGTGNNDSEITLRRCLFRNCGESGVSITGYNALDYWIWDCTFDHCKMGIICAFGGYHAYRCFFSGSGYSDVVNNGGYYVSVRGCYSDHSNEFSMDLGGSSNPFKRVFQDNIVVAPKAAAIEYYHCGKLSFWGNKITKAPDTNAKVSLNFKAWSGYMAEVLSQHNIYEQKIPLWISSNPHKIYSYQDQIGTSFRPDVQAFKKTMDVLPGLVARPVLEVPAGASTDNIQSILNQAARLKGQRPVVHFGAGTYFITKTLLLPAGSDMQLTGDGLLGASIIRAQTPQAFGQSPLLFVSGPSYISIRDLSIGSEADKGQNVGLVFEKMDQQKAQAHFDQIYSSHSDTSLSVRGMNYLYIQKDNSFFTYGNFVEGGPMMSTGKGTAGVACFGGQFSGLSVQKNGSFVAKDCWYEGGGRVPVDLNGSGTVTIDGTMMAPPNADSTPTIRIGKFAGKVSLMNMYVQGSVGCGPDNPGLSLLLWNIHFYYKMNPLDIIRANTSYKAAGLGLNTQCFRPNDPACQNISWVEDKWQNLSDINLFLDDMTAQTRTSRPLLYKDLPAGVSNIYMTRVSFGMMKKSIEFK
jgi:hypothetical protein